MRTSWMLLASEKVACATCSAEVPAAAIVQLESPSRLPSVRCSRSRSLRGRETPLGSASVRASMGRLFPRSATSDYASARVGSRPRAGCRERLSHRSPTRRIAISLAPYQLRSCTFLLVCWSAICSSTACSARGIRSLIRAALSATPAPTRTRRRLSHNIDTAKHPAALLT